MTRRRLAPTSLLALLTLGLVALAPSAGIRIHRHVADGPAHVHFEDLLGISPSGTEPSSASRRGDDSPPAKTHRVALRGPALDSLSFEAQALAPLAAPATASATFHRPLHAAHAHASSPFLRTLPAALAFWVVAVFVLAAAPDRAARWPHPPVARARARSPPLASRSLQAI